METYGISQGLSGAVAGCENMFEDGDMMEVDRAMEIDRPMDEVLPVSMLMEILSRLPDARHLVRCSTVNHSFRQSFRQVKSVRFVCREKKQFPFKGSVTDTLSQMQGVENLRLEIEENMQGKRFKEDELDRDSLWLSEKNFVSTWLPPVAPTLQHLTLVDYGQQAIFKTSPLLQLLSKHCPNLQTLELRNMYLDCSEFAVMRKVRSLTLRCVKMVDAGLKQISLSMPNLEILTLVTVVGLKEADFTSDSLKILCLGLATRVKSVKLCAKSLVKLQLKMPCPESLRVKAPNLKSLALCVQNNSLEFDKVYQLRELLMGASDFTTLYKLSTVNRDLEKVFLDVPCMAFEEKGNWRGVLNGVLLRVPDMETMRESCPNLQTLSVGPGLWYSFEKLMTKRDSNSNLVLPKWPGLQRLILHVIVIEETITMDLLKALVQMLQLNTLEVYVHECSTISAVKFSEQMMLFCPGVRAKVESWKKGLKFGCFNF